MTEAWENPDHEWNSKIYHTGKVCVEDGCTKPAGTAWSPHWCYECNVKRMQRITATLERSIESPGGQDAKKRP